MVFCTVGVFTTVTLHAVVILCVNINQLHLQMCQIAVMNYIYQSFFSQTSCRNICGKIFWVWQMINFIKFSFLCSIYPHCVHDICVLVLHSHNMHLHIRHTHINYGVWALTYYGIVLHLVIETIQKTAPIRAIKMLIAENIIIISFLY